MIGTCEGVYLTNSKEELEQIIFPIYFKRNSSKEINRIIVFTDEELNVTELGFMGKNTFTDFELKHKLKKLNYKFKKINIEENCTKYRVVIEIDLINREIIYPNAESDFLTL